MKYLLVLQCLPNCQRWCRHELALKIAYGHQMGTFLRIDFWPSVLEKKRVRAMFKSTPPDFDLAFPLILFPDALTDLGRYHVIAMAAVLPSVFDSQQVRISLLSPSSCPMMVRFNSPFPSPAEECPFQEPK